MAGMPRFENSWSVGNVLTLIGMAVGGMAVYADTSAQIRVLTQMVTEYRADVAEMREMRVKDDTRIRTLELSMSRIEEKLVSMAATMTRVEEAVSRTREVRNEVKP